MVRQRYARVGTVPQNPPWPSSAEGAEPDEVWGRYKAMIGHSCVTEWIIAAFISIIYNRQIISVELISASSSPCVSDAYVYIKLYIW